MIATSVLATLIALTPVSAPANPISTESVTETMHYLTQDALAGRMTMSSGAGMAAKYLAARSKALGMRPYGKSFLWDFPVSVNKKLGKHNLLTLSLSGKGSLTLKPGIDYVPLPNSPEVAPISAEAIWMGLGSTSINGNDYDKIDVKGKVVVVMRGMPAGMSPMSNQAKARAASERGAIGILFIGPMFGGARDLPATSASQGISRNSTIVAAGISARFAKNLTGKSFDELKDDLSPRALGVGVALQTDLEPAVGTAQNVVAVLPGTDPRFKDEYIVVGAHYDHLGFAETGSRTGVEQIHYGADDNASGSAAILEIARYYAATRSNRRTLIFQWYCGEELGLLGSEAWAKAHPEVIRKTHVMVNLDMVGRLRDGKVTIYGSESSKELPKLLDAIQQPDLNVIRDASIPGNSDHFSYTRRNVVAIAPFTGFHDEYHTQNDKFETINLEGIATIAKGVTQFIDAADALNYSMIFRPAKKPAAARQPSDGPRRVRTGFIPDMGGEGKGVKLNGVGAGSPAEKAGVKAGDLLIKFGDMAITSLEDLQAALQKAQPGVAVRIVVLRDGKEVELTITPVAADPN